MGEGGEVFRAMGGHETREVICEEIGARTVHRCEEVGGRVGYIDGYFECCVGRET